MWYYIWDLTQKIRPYFIRQSGDLNLLGKLLKVGLAFLIIKYLKKLINNFIDRGLRAKSLKEGSLDQRRLETVGRMFKNLAKVLLYFYFVVMVLEMFNIDTKSILATAGIGGVAIGFGAQSLVKDVINGFFILQDNLYVVGDHIEVEGLEGIVEDLGLRVTKIRGFSGDLHIIPNGEVKLITNRSRGAIRALNIISIAYEENIDKAIEVLDRICQEVRRDYREDLVSGPNVDGVVNLGESGVDIRITAMAISGEQWKIERVIRKKAKEEFERMGIEIPYNKVVLINEDGGDRSVGN